MKEGKLQMEQLSPAVPHSQRRLRAMVEFIDDELKIYPIAETDEQTKEVMRRLLLWRRDDG
jgi:hypothetical protein